MNTKDSQCDNAPFTDDSFMDIEEPKTPPETQSWGDNYPLTPTSWGFPKLNVRRRLIFSSPESPSSKAPKSDKSNTTSSDKSSDESESIETPNTAQPTMSDEESKLIGLGNFYKTRSWTIATRLNSIKIDEKTKSRKSTNPRKRSLPENEEQSFKRVKNTKSVKEGKPADIPKIILRRSQRKKDVQKLATAKRSY